MVTVEEARQTITQQQQQVEAERARVRATKLRELTKAELLRRTMQQREQYRTQQQQLDIQKSRALAEITKYETEQLRPYEVQVRTAEATASAAARERAQWAQARKLIIEGKTLAARGDPSLQSKIRKLRAGMPEPTIATPTVTPLTAYKHILTGKMLYQSFPYGKAPAMYRPVAVSPTTLKELPAIEQFKLKLKKPELFVAPKVPEIPKYKPPTTILGGEPFTIWKAPLYAAKVIEKSYPYQKAISYTKTKYPTIHKLLTYPAPRIVEDIASTVTMWAFFSPVMGTTAFQKLKIKGRFEELGKLDIESKRKMGRAVISKIEKDLLRMKTPKEQWKYMAKLAKQVKTEEQRTGFRILMEELTEKNILKTIPITPTVSRFPAPTVTKEVPIMFYEAPKIKGISIIGEAVSRFPEPEPLFFREEVKVKEKVIPTITPALAVVPALVTALKAKQIQVPKLKQPQVLAVIPKLKPKLAMRSLLLQKYALKLKQVPKQIPKYKPPFYRPPTPKIPIPIPKLRTVKITKDYKITKSDIGYEYYVRRAGRWILMGTAETLTEASRKASAIVAATLAAAFRIMRKERIVTAPFGRMFRPAKREVGVIVQRRKFRLAARAEVKEIQWFKKKKGRKTKWI